MHQRMRLEYEPKSGAIWPIYSFCASPKGSTASASYIESVDSVSWFLLIIMSISFSFRPQCKQRLAQGLDQVSDRLYNLSHRGHLVKVISIPTNRPKDTQMRVTRISTCFDPVNMPRIAATGAYVNEIAQNTRLSLLSRISSFSKGSLSISFIVRIPVFFGLLPLPEYHSFRCRRNDDLGN